MIGEIEYKPFYKAKEIDKKPYLVFDFVAVSEEELERLELSNNPLILREDELPAIEFGVFKKKIKDGKLVNRTITKKIKDEYEISRKKPKIKAINADIKKAIAKGFEYNGKTFSNEMQHQMTWANLMIQHLSGNTTDQVILTIDDEEYSLKANKIPAFYQAYIDNLNSYKEEEKSRKKAL